MANNIFLQEQADLIANLPISIKQNIEDVVKYSLGHADITVDNIVLGFRENYPELTTIDLEAISDYLNFFSQILAAEIIEEQNHFEFHLPDDFYDDGISNNDFFWDQVIHTISVIEKYLIVSMYIVNKKYLTIVTSFIHSLYFNLYALTFLGYPQFDLTLFSC